MTLVVLLDWTTVVRWFPGSIQTERLRRPTKGWKSNTHVFQVQGRLVALNHLFLSARRRHKFFIHHQPTVLPGRLSIWLQAPPTTLFSLKKHTYMTASSPLSRKYSFINMGKTSTFRVSLAHCVTCSRNLFLSRKQEAQILDITIITFHSGRHRRRHIISKYLSILVTGENASEIFQKLGVCLHLFAWLKISQIVVSFVGGFTFFFVGGVTVISTTTVFIWNIYSAAVCTTIAISSIHEYTSPKTNLGLKSLFSLTLYILECIADGQVQWIRCLTLLLPSGFKVIN